MKNIKTQHISILGLLFLIPSFCLLALLFSLAGADFVISTASWKEALIWSVFVFLGWSFVLWSTHVYSPDLALILSVLLWVCIVIGSQWYYYISQRSDIVRYRSEGKQVIVENTQRDLNHIYNLYIQKTLNDPDVHGWWGHIKLVAHEGIIHRERLGMRKFGGKYADVERHGWQIIFAWLISYVFLAFACLMGMIGSAIRNPQKNRQVINEDQQNPDESVKPTIKKKPYIYQPMIRSTRPKIEPQAVARLIGTQNQNLINTITEDLLMAANFYEKDGTPHEVDSKRKKVIDRLTQQYGAFDKNRKPYVPEYLMMHSALIYQQHFDEIDFYHCHCKIHDVYAHFKFGIQLPQFRNIDLAGLDYKCVDIDPLWKSLLGEGANFYDRDSAWGLFEEESAEDIPEGAYLAILYQTIHCPDSRLYDGWHGVEPYDLVKRLGPRLRDALLTYLHDWPIWFPQHEFYRLEGLAAIAGKWPENIAEPIMERCIKSGWRDSLRQIPETQFWVEFLDKYEPTPFGSLKNSVRWYSHYKYKKQ